MQEKELVRTNEERGGDPGPIISFALADVARLTRMNYKGHLRDFLEWLDGRPLNYVAVVAYKETLVEEGAGASTVNQALSAIKRLARELQRAGKLEHQVASAIGDVAGVTQRGQKVHRWLSRAEVERLLQAPDANTTRGKRDRALLGLVYGCALRRSEAAAATWGHLQRRGDTHLLANVLGKGNKVRSVPLPAWLRPLLSAWKVESEPAGEETPILRAVGRWGHVREGGITPQAIYDIVGDWGKAIGVPELTPHDLRRSWAIRAYRQNPDRLDQISLILGHASLRTTEIYLGLDSVDLDDPLTVEV